MVARDDDPPAAGRRRFMTAAALGAGALALPAAGRAQAPLEVASRDTARSLRRPAPSDPDGGVSGIVSAHIAGARFTDLGASAVEEVKLRLLDLVGCAIGGVRGEGAAALARVVTPGVGSQGQASVLGTGGMATAREAAMANAILARSYDFEVMTVLVDGDLVPSHHAPTTVMTALALAEQHRVSGRTFLTALAVGDDLAARTLAAAGLDFNDGWDGVPLHATMAAAGVAANLKGFDPVVTRHALGLAADQIGGTVQSIWDGAAAWKVQQGTAARNGIFSAELAAAGWTGMSDPLLGPCGLYGQFTPGCARPARLTTDLGRTWHGEVYFKPYPSCAANHPAIECALTLRDKAGLDPAAIASVRLLLAPSMLSLFVAKPFRGGPSAHSQANFSIRFATATALLRGALRQDDYEPAAYTDPALVSLIDRTTLSPLPTGTKGVIVEVRLDDGRTLREALPGRPRGYVAATGSRRAEVEAKFHHQVAFAGTVPAARADAIVRRIDELERERDMASFARLLADIIRFPKGQA